jgi:hypothetical protein
MMTPEELRKLTNQAIDRAKQEREMKIKADYEAELRQDKEAELKAESIIAQIPGRAETEAKAGRSHAVVMGLRYGEYTVLDGKWGGTNARAVINPKGVDGKAALIVWTYCQNAGLDPKLEYWHDGAGIDGGYNIVIRW